MTNDELEDFLAEVAWEPFQFYSGNEILQAINDLADRFEMIAKDAREKAIDSVIELLKSKATITNNQSKSIPWTCKSPKLTYQRWRMGLSG
jgi:hypothetical protein